jgi:hypothetical protein
MTKQLRQRWLDALDVVCRSRTRYDPPARLLRELARQFPSLWAEAKESFATEEAVRRIAARCKLTSPASDLQLKLFE